MYQDESHYFTKTNKLIKQTIKNIPGKKGKRLCRPIFRVSDGYKQ